MNTAEEKLDKIRCMACYGEEFEAVYIKLDRLKAVTECADVYADNANPEIEGKPQREQWLCILSSLRVVEEIAKEVESGLDKSIRRLMELTDPQA